jgi:probable F420-dependent oxidoreductase
MSRTPALRFGFSGSPFASADEIVDSAQRAERAGFDVFVLADLPGGLSPLVALASVARATTRIRLGTIVLNTGLWSPPTAARELASLDQVAGGRVEIALGSGLPLPAVRALMPATPAARFARLQETVEVIASTVAEPGATPGFAGRPPLLVAGGGERTLRLAAEHADGFIIGFVPPVPKVRLPAGTIALPEATATQRLLDRVREYAGARAGDIEFGTGVSVTVTDDSASAAQELARVHTYLTPDQIRASPKALIGSAEEIATQVVDRGRRLGLTYHVMHGAAGPETLAPILAHARGA